MTWMTRYIEAWDRLDEASVGAFHAEDGICDDVASDKVYNYAEHAIMPRKVGTPLRWLSV